jgi:hypothetical protein
MHARYTVFEVIMQIQFWSISHLWSCAETSNSMTHFKIATILLSDNIPAFHRAVSQICENNDFSVSEVIMQEIKPLHISQ